MAHAVLRNPRTGATAHLPEHLVARYLKGGWEVLAPSRPPAVLPAVMTGWSVAETVAWVDGNPIRARLALTHELSRGRPRVTLVDQLNRLVDSDNPHEGEGEEE